MFIFARTFPSLVLVMGLILGTSLLGHTTKAEAAQPYPRTEKIELLKFSGKNQKGYGGNVKKTKICVPTQGAEKTKKVTKKYNVKTKWDKTCALVPVQMMKTPPPTKTVIETPQPTTEEVPASQPETGTQLTVEIIEGDPAPAGVEPEPWGPGTQDWDKRFTA